MLVGLVARVQSPRPINCSSPDLFGPVVSCSLTFGVRIFSLSPDCFSGKYALSRRKCATSSAGWVYFAVAISSNAKDQLYYHVRAEDDDFRDGRKPRAVAANSSALSLYPLSPT